MWDKNYVVMIENAYFACKPPTQTAAAPRKVRPILHEYIRRSLFVDLNAFTTEQILKRLRYASLRFICFVCFSFFPPFLLVQWFDGFGCFVCVM